MSKSIRQQLLLWLMVPLLGLSAVSAGCSYLLAYRLSNSVYDKELINSADSVATRFTVQGDQVRVELPKDTEEIISHSYKDRFFYQILSSDGGRVAGMDGLPKPASVPSINDPPFFRDETLNGTPIRAVVLRMIPPTTHKGSVIVQVAETLNARRELAQNIMLGIILPQLTLIVIAVLAVRIGIFRSIAPLYEIKDAVDRRSPQDLSPIDDQSAPEEVKSLLRAFNNLFARARDDIARQQRFASNAAHQLRTPLAGLNTYLELAEKLSKDAEMTRMISQLHNGVDRMTRTVQQLLSLSRAEQTSVSFSVVDLNLLVSDATAEIVPEAIRLNIEIEFQVSDVPATVLGDSVSLREMTTNLLENAIRYNKSGGHVLVSVTRTGGLVNLSVEDNGVGIPESERTRVFERFYRVSGSDLDVVGSGLGLSIVGEIAKLHQAEIELHNGRDNCGTRILVKFPENQN
ncbi:MAG: sensor histidine kinase N-terminal domain-containing protein [Cyanobacteria bacterium]|nr:sensor histidine kinase N-terminal domain-containing protein [Cyanobacteriota bacterium]